MGHTEPMGRYRGRGASRTITAHGRCGFQPKEGVDAQGTKKNGFQVAKPVAALDATRPRPSHLGPQKVVGDHQPERLTQRG